MTTAHKDLPALPDQLLGNLNTYWLTADGIADTFVKVSDVRAALARPEPASTPVAVDLRPDSKWIDRFAEAMKEKMYQKHMEGRGGWDDDTQCTMEDLARMLVEHVTKGDPVDIANFAMMLHQREWMATEEHPCHGGSARRAITQAAPQASAPGVDAWADPSAQASKDAEVERNRVWHWSYKNDGPTIDRYDLGYEAARKDVRAMFGPPTAAATKNLAQVSGDSAAELSAMIAVEESMQIKVALMDELAEHAALAKAAPQGQQSAASGDGCAGFQGKPVAGCTVCDGQGCDGTAAKADPAQEAGAWNAALERAAQGFELTMSRSDNVDIGWVIDGIRAVKTAPAQQQGDAS